MKRIILGLIFISFLFSCRNKNNKIGNEAKESDNSLTTQKIVLTIVDSNNMNFVKQIFPLKWERFGIDNGDTVTYSFCNANNPEFSISNDLKSIEIIIGNELNATFQIEKLMFNDSILRMHLMKNAHWIDSCTMILQDKDKLISIFYTNDDSGMTYSFLPKTKLEDKRRIEEECDDEDI